MRKYIKDTTKTTIVYDANDIDSLIETKRLFIASYKKAKRALKVNPRNFNAKVDVCFYRLLFKKLNKILEVIQSKGKYIEKPIIEIQRLVEVHSNNKNYKNRRNKNVWKS